MDGLWQSTCFELFAKPDNGDPYLEYNFAPGGAWAAYGFEEYRQGQSNLSIPIPLIEPIEDGVRASGTFDRAMGSISSYGLSAVIEETGGTKSYWALAHPPGKPDFHHPTCFAATLPAPDSPCS